jgi:hypothetical protein
LKLAIAALAVAGGFGGAMMLAPTDAKSPKPPVAAIAVEGAAPQGISGNEEQLVLEVLETLERRPNIAAALRQSMRLGVDRLTGEGQYWQQGVGNQRRTRWELTTLVAGERAFLTQVYDGEVVWIDRKFPAARKVTRIDVGVLRRQTAVDAESATQSAAPGAMLPELLARGGVSQLIASLHRCFTFGSRHTLQRGNQTVLAVLGQWRPEQLEINWPGLTTANPADWPLHLPHHVLLYIDASDRFPYLIEYRGADQAYLASGGQGIYAAQDSLATYEFIDVQFAAAMPADIFEFTPPDNNWLDITARVVESLRPPPAPVTETNTARRTGTWR